ncbi:MAG TPA: flagellar basal-body MS-ring/collar protein FliF [Acetobacteraceae bacterium]|nr:flagellar basal-body MS-ring/collar protein FliF [Acetobacteraceae bacterium]
MKALLDGLKALGPARLAAMGAVALGLLGLLAFMVLRAGSGDQMALLYGDLDPRDASQMVDKLNQQHIPYRVGAGGGEILVPADQVPQARMLLAKEGLPSGGSIGYELFDRGDGYLFSAFQQKISETRAMEGELARTILAIHGIRGARVMLVLPHREPFAREQQEAQASVMLTMVGAQRLDKEGIQAILNLVAAAVPGLRTQNIAVVDSRGDLLARAGQPTTQLTEAATAEEVRRTTEMRLARAVEDMLEKTLGPGRVRAEASVRMDFDKLNETKELFDPDQQVTRSTQTVNSTSKTTEANQAVTAQNNLPNADAGAPGNGSQEGRQEETTNYEIGKTVRTLIHEQPRIDRISLAVMVDGTEQPGADGKPAWQPRSAEDLDRITNLVKSAIGFDEKRGDQVDVVSMRFVDDNTLVADNGGLFGLHLEKPDFMHLAQTALFGVIGLLALLLVLRPMVARLTALTPGGFALADGTGGGMMSGGIPSVSAPNGMQALPAPGPLANALSGLTAGALAAAQLEDESMISLGQIEGQMRASSLRKLTDIVGKHPDETLTIMRGWMAQEDG